MTPGRAPLARTRPDAVTGSRAELEDERAFLLSSIEDLDAEREVGDIADPDYRALRDRYTVRAAAVLRALQRPSDEPPSDQRATAPAVRSRRRRRTVLVWGALGAFAAAGVVLVAAEVETRLPGQTTSGSISLSSTEQLQRTLAQAQALETAGKPAQALSLYRDVLRRDPTQEQALSESGWLEFEAGIDARNPTALSQGQRDEQAAELAEPGAYAPHLYLGSMLLVERRPSDAAAEFARFVSTGPPAEVVQRAWPFLVRAYGEAGRPAPAPPPGVSG